MFLAGLWKSRCLSRRYLDREETVSEVRRESPDCLKLTSPSTEMVRVKAQQQATPKPTATSRFGATSKKASALKTTEPTNKAIASGKDTGIPTCNGCGICISSDIKAFQCDKCQSNSAWKCIDCVNVKGDTYDEISQGGECELQWICTDCNKSAYLGEKMDSLVGMIAKLIDRIVNLESTVGNIQQEISGVVSSAKEEQQQADQKNKQLESHFNKKVDEMVGKISSQIDAVRSSLDNKLDLQDSKDNVVAVEEKVNQIIVKLEKQKKDNHDLHDCVQDAINMKLQEDKEESKEIKKRSTSIIIHGLLESTETDKQVRLDCDENLITNLLHEINCDDVSVQSTVRLGAFDSNQSKPRPLKVVISSEQQKDKILQQTKNLRHTKVKELEKIFIHQDLTVKQRKARNLLVQEMKQRLLNGETNLIIVNNRIVTRKTRQNPRSEIFDASTPTQIV